MTTRGTGRATGGFGPNAGPVFGGDANLNGAWTATQDTVGMAGSTVGNMSWIVGGQTGAPFSGICQHYWPR